MKTTIAWVAAAALSLTAMGSAGAASSAPGDAPLRQLADDYLDHFYFPFNPSAATGFGVHQYDTQLEDYTRAGITRQVKLLHQYLQRFEALDAASMSEQARADDELLQASIHSTLLTLETIKPWQLNADFYSSTITASAYSLMQREFAPPNQRLRLLIARERKMPALLRAARTNLADTPQIFTQIALEQLPDDVSFFQNDLPSAFTGADDAQLQAQFKSANAQLIAALQSYGLWLKQQLLPRSHGEFRLGAQTFSAKLRYDEMVDTPLDRLLEIGLADMHHNQEEFARVAKQLAPDKSAQQVLAQLATDYPPPDKLLDTFRATFDGLVGFISERHIVTVPSTVRPILRETPPFMRATTFASMDTPGPFETQAKEAYFNVTLPEANWDPKRVAGFMAQFNYPVISNVAVHEAYPGHYIQFLWMHNIDDRVRKVIGASSNAEGWAHYCEQMMLDEGFGQSGPGAQDAHGALMLRLGQLQDALLRDARYVVAIKMHTQGMTLPQAIDVFVKDGYQSPEVGEIEAKRGTGDPTYLYYTLGKLQILKLRADLKAREGDAFQLQAFHDAFMQQGFPPIRLVRRAMLHDDSPTL